MYLVDYNNDKVEIYIRNQDGKVYYIIDNYSFNKIKCLITTIDINNISILKLNMIKKVINVIKSY